MFAFKKSWFVCWLVFLISDSSCNENNSDKYITSSKSECFTSKNVFSCIKYKTARFIWSVAVGQVQLINSPAYSEHFNLVRIPNNGEATEFSEYRFEPDVSETSKALSFLKRSFHMFLTTHGFQISFGKDSGARLISDLDGSEDLTAENRGKKKKKLALILPLLILFKMMKLKMMLMKVLFGIGVIQLLLVAGGAFLFYYLKHNTHCKIQGHPIHTHSHVLEPEEHESYSSYPGYHFSQPSYHSSASYAKDWANNRAYNAFNNYMDSSHSSPP